MQTSNFKIQLTGNTFHVGFEIELPLVSKPTVELRLAIHKYHLGIYIHIFYLSIIWIPKNINHNISKKWKFRENVDIGIRYILLQYYQGRQISQCHKYHGTGCSFAS